MYLEKHFFGNVFEFLLGLIESPLFIKSKAVPKSLKKKIRKKYILKIAYLDKTKRLNNAYKLLHNYSQMLEQANFKTRLYKALLHTFLEHKESYLYKLKYSFLKSLKNFKIT